MALWFCNKYPSDVWVCILWYHPNCGDDSDWEKKGWWHLPPFPWAAWKVFGGDLEDINRFWYFHAHAADGAFWAGSPTTHVPHHAFDWCERRGETGARIVGLREVDVGGNDDYTINLVP
jgi:hypothetical protein